MIKVTPQLNIVDVALALSELWEISDSCLFMDNGEDDYAACSITCFRGKERATLGLVYTKNGGAAQIFNGQLEVVAQSLEKLSQEDYYGLRNMMLQINKNLPTPTDVSKDDLK